MGNSTFQPALGLAAKRVFNASLKLKMKLKKCYPTISYCVRIFPLDMSGPMIATFIAVSGHCKEQGLDRVLPAPTQKMGRESLNRTKNQITKDLKKQRIPLLSGFLISYQSSLFLYIFSKGNTHRKSVAGLIMLSPVHTNVQA